MSAIGGSTSQVLGATTAVAAGVAVLPDTGVNPVARLMVLMVISFGSLSLLSFLVTRIVKRFI
ncbi:MAG: hypothetical protein US53_C0007G0022 [Candidatus Woesebacteria bacterium GW2011_GWA1_37_7]|uniref:Uncharacterized protein n=1 Tax=Candidatus Woesebacteria bacterium GW2011_GWA1_37_7 TaxID=1618545 RepID=A0A0G0H3P0_9BACT|nr:MAG: hypothetical protein US53_C0007G0022 [Candidatus Woesebacteria bacterium GW2011_GWA1_37_7]